MTAHEPLDPVAAEARLATAVETGDESLVTREFAAIGRDSLEFTGRCFALAITSGMCNAAVLFGEAGFHLNVMDEPAVQAELAVGDAGTRGLVGFLQRYRTCRAQRTYYLPVVQAAESVGPVRELLAVGRGLNERDCSELLSLAVRQDNVKLARVLVEGGAQLACDIHDAAPDGLAAKMGLAAPNDPWAEQLSPRSSLETIAFVLEQMEGRPCPIRADWFKLYFRDAQFGEKLALIAPHGSAATCEDASALLAELARGGHVRAVHTVLAWDGLDPAATQPALDIARAAGHVEIAAALLQASRPAQPALEPLSF